MATKIGIKPACTANSNCMPIDDNALGHIKNAWVHQQVFTTLNYFIQIGYFLTAFKILEVTAYGLLIA